jgi:hypothetical protein
LYGGFFRGVFRSVLGIGRALAPLTLMTALAAPLPALMATLAASAFLEAATASALATAFVRVIVLRISIAHAIGSNDRLF